MLWDMFVIVSQGVKIIKGLDPGLSNRHHNFYRGGPGTPDKKLARHAHSSWKLCFSRKKVNISFLFGQFAAEETSHYYIAENGSF